MDTSYLDNALSLHNNPQLMQNILITAVTTGGNRNDISVMV